MKKSTILLFLIVCAIGNIRAQGAKDFRLNFGFQGNFPEQKFNSNIPKYNKKNGGGGGHIYPKWFYNTNLSLGLNMEYIVVTEDYQTDDIGTFDVLSFSPTFNYYFFKSKIRPFVGVGIGAYHLIYLTPKFNLGIKPLIGVSFYQFFDLSLEYTRILNKININPNSRGHFDNYYVGIKGSFSVGLLRLKK